MLRTTTLLTVTMLLGSPGVSLACELWCVGAAGQGHHAASGSHEHSAPPAEEAELLSADECPMPELTPFLGDTRQTQSRVLAALTLPAWITPTPAALAEGNGQSVLAVHPFCPTTSRTVLRI